MIFFLTLQQIQLRKKKSYANKRNEQHLSCTAGGWGKLPTLISSCFLLILINFKSFSGASLTFLNNQEIQDGGSKMAVGIS